MPKCSENCKCGKHYKSPEHRANLSKSLKGKKQSVETRKKKSLAAKGKSHFWNKDLPQNKSGWKHSEETRKVMSEKRKLRVTKDSTREKIREAGKKRHQENPQFLATICQKRENRKTKVEIKVDEILTELGYKFEYNPAHERFQLDFVIKDLGVNLEVDGHHWHTIEGRPEWDKYRDEVLESQGYKVVRIWDWEVWKNGEQLVEERLLAI